MPSLETSSFASNTIRTTAIPQPSPTSTTTTTTTPATIGDNFFMPFTKDCSVVTKTETVSLNDCVGTVNDTYCSGECSSRSWFNEDTGNMENECSCCVPLQWKRVRFYLQCPPLAVEFVYRNVISACQCTYEYCTKFDAGRK
ncbi:mucin-6-like [Protopterus annectens]|uniref:mucin-6-like n=1 Tax=Protopterus annectens TaxID=7888 RepID=UPI001CFB2E3D|nr:mucin-6-like [Protopterus annectens]